MLKELITAAQSGDFDTLDNLLDDNNVDLTSDEFKFKVTDSKRQDIVLSKLGLTSDTFAGSIPATTSDGYQLVQCSHKTQLGLVSISPDGSYSYKITKSSVLSQLNADTPAPYNLKDTIVGLYKKIIIIGTAGHHLLAYAAHGHSAAGVQKLLSAGCCPNYNTAPHPAVLRARGPVNSGTADKFAAESRPLLNAIRAGKKDVVETLVNFSCPCCDGAGAKVTDLLIEEAAKKGGEIHNYLLSVK